MGGGSLLFSLHYIFVGLELKPTFPDAVSHRCVPSTKDRARHSVCPNEHVKQLSMLLIHPSPIF